MARNSGRGFASMDRDEQRRISSMGGRASQGGRGRNRQDEEDYEDEDYDEEEYYDEDFDDEGKTTSASIADILSNI